MFALQAGISYDIFMYHKRPGKQAHYYDIQWYRQTGVFYPKQLSSETPAVGVSANTWREYMDLIRKAAADHPTDHPADHPAHRFISPELMTTADMDLPEIPDQRDVVDDRLAKLEELSTSMPTAELVVGTPEYHPDGIYNSLVIIQNGIRRVLERKRTIFSSSAERGIFTASNTLQQRCTRTLSAVCADLVGYGMQYPQYPKLPQDTRAIHASCCWATPLEEGAHYAAAPDEKRYTSTMTRTLDYLFAHPQLQQVMVVDRTPPSTAIPPLNCVARRKTHNGIIES